LYAKNPPELVVEVKSRDDRWAKVYEKIGEYLEAGVRVVCVIDPATETVTVHHAEEPVQSLKAGDELRFPSVLGDFSMPVKKIFE
jgi:Uma2 family endonuclease